MNSYTVLIQAKISGEFTILADTDEEATRIADSMADLNGWQAVDTYVEILDTEKYDNDF